MTAKQKLIVALDVPTFERAAELIDILSPEVDIFKVGIAPFTGYGQAVLEKLGEKGKKVFLDLKVHDIPNTAENAARAAAAKNVHMMNFHCLGGLEMMKAAVKGAGDCRSGKDSRPLLLGVTILTSMGEREMREMGFSGTTARDKVIELACLADKAGMDGVVASAEEARAIKEKIGGHFIVVVPGIRPGWSVKGDQKRVMTPASALGQGADYLVVGRPIIAADDPLDAAVRVLREMEQAE